MILESRGFKSVGFRERCEERELYMGGAFRGCGGLGYPGDKRGFDRVGWSRTGSGRV